MSLDLEKIVFALAPGSACPRHGRREIPSAMVVAVIGVNGSVSDSLADLLTRRLERASTRYTAHLRHRIESRPGRRGSPRVVETGARVTPAR